MISSLEVQVLYPARWRRRISEAQGRRREAGSEGSMEKPRPDGQELDTRPVPGRTLMRTERQGIRLAYRGPGGSCPGKKTGSARRQVGALRCRHPRSTGEDLYDARCESLWHRLPGHFVTRQATLYGMLRSGCWRCRSPCLRRIRFVSRTAIETNAGVGVGLGLLYSISEHAGPGAVLEVCVGGRMMPAGHPSGDA